MVCTLLNTNDLSGVWLFRSLEQKGVKNILLISIDELLYASRFTCGLQNGKAFFNIQLRNGLELTDQNVTAVLNRVQQLPVNYAERFNPEDRSYVQQEMTAVFTFLFSIFPNQIFNKSSGMGLCGQLRSQLEWMQLAEKAGFKTGELLYENKLLQNTDNYLFGQSESVLFFNGRCFGTGSFIHPALSASCLTLGSLSNERILEIYVQQTSPDTFAFTGVNIMPTFKGIGNDFLNELALQL